MLKHRPAPRGNTRAPYKVACEDDTGRIDLVFFHAERKFIERQLPTGAIRTVSGRIESYNDKKQMTHPDYIVAPEARADLPMLEPVYPLTAGLSGKVLLKAARQAIERVPALPEWQDAAWLRQRGWPDAATALAHLHRPEDHPTFRRPPRPGSGWPTTSCWPASWRWPWCARASSRSRAAAWRATAASAPASPTRCPSA